MDQNYRISSLSPSELRYKRDPLENEISMRNHKVRTVMKKLSKINKSIEPKFKLAKYDFEELKTSQNLKLGEWNREPNKTNIVNHMKEERRKEYWKRRIKASNPVSSKSVDR